MKKNLFLLILILFTASGCAPAIDKEVDKQENINAGLANPASTYCLEQGGEVEIRDTEEGQVGYCVFPSGAECEEWAFYRGECSPSEQEGDEQKQARQIAREWIENNSPTYKFDGMNLQFENISELDCQNCYETTFTFNSRQAGYGDRTGQFLAQVITPHTIAVKVEGGEVTSAITDEKFNEMKGSLIESD